jgi:protein TonB
MAFGERFMGAQTDTRAAKRKAITGTVAIVVHAMAIVFAIVWSFIHVEELTPPQVTVTFLAAAAPPPPPPPPPPPKRKSSTPKVVPTTQPVDTKVVVQQKEKEPEPEEDDGGEDDGVEGGVKGGVKGGVVGGVKGGVVGGTLGAPPPPPKDEPPVFITPTMEQPRRVLGRDPTFTPEARAARLSGDVLLKVCLNKAGGVADVKVIKGMPMGLTEAAVAAAKTWRYAPYKVGGKPVAACQMTRLRFQLQ